MEFFTQQELDFFATLKKNNPIKKVTPSIVHWESS